MTLTLSDQEWELLLQLVEREVSDLGPEIRHTTTSGLRDELKRDKHTLRRLLERMRAPGTPATT